MEIKLLISINNTYKFMNQSISYVKRIKNRTFKRFFLGLLVRLFLYFMFWVNRQIARCKGAKVGHSSIIPLGLALKANANLVVGEDVIIESEHLDLRSKIIIEDHCIIGKGVSILRVSHYLDSTFTTKYYKPLVIESYSWLATGAKVLPSCELISKGTVIGAWSVVVHNTLPSCIYSGFPAKKLKDRPTLFDDLVVVSLKGGDLLSYIKAYYD